MVDGFDMDMGFDSFGLADFGGVAGFDGFGFGDLGGLGDLGGFDPTMTAFDGMGFDGLGLDALGLDASGFDALGFEGLGLDATAFDLGGAGLDATDMGFELDLGFENLGYGSDLDDVILAPDMGGLIDLDLADPLDTGSDIDTFAPHALPGLSPTAAMGPGAFGSPFLPPAAGGVAMTGGVAAASVGSGLVLPSEMLYCPTDSFSLPTPSPGRLALKIADWLSTKGKGVIKDAVADMAKDEVRDRVKAGAKGIFAVMRQAASAAS